MVQVTIVAETGDDNKPNDQGQDEMFLYSKKSKV